MSARLLNYRASSFLCMPLQDNLPAADGYSRGCPWQCTAWCGCHNQTVKLGAPYNLPVTEGLSEISVLFLQRFSALTHRC